MNADEIVNALRRIREVRIFGNDQTQLMADAADLIESLQAQLAESQRRERAAVDFIKYLDRNYSGYMAEDERFEQWRGPMAGKGEAE